MDVCMGGWMCFDGWMLYLVSFGVSSVNSIDGWKDVNW